MSWLSDLWHGFIDWLMPNQDAQGSYITKTGTNQYIPVVYGEQRVSGITIFKRSSDREGGPWNDYLHLVIVLCEGEIQAIDEVFFNGISQNDSRWGSEWYHIEKFLGSDNQAACTTLVNHRVGWTSTDKLNGLAYLYVRFRQNKDLNKWQGEPEISVRMRGKKVKNLSTQITEYSTVPAYCLYDYLTRPRYGKGASEVLIDQGSFLASAAFTSSTISATENQVIDEIRTIGDVFPGWGSIDWSTGADRWEELELPSLFTQINNQALLVQPLMSCNVTLDTSKTIFENTKVLLSGMRGMVPDTTGIIKLVHETSGSPVFAFDDTNIIGGLKLEIKGRKGKANQVTLSFKNKALNFEDDTVVFPESDSALHVQWLVEDNNVDLPDQIDMPTINNKAEALQMCEVIARLSRNFFHVTFDADMSSVNVEPTDIVSITDDFYGFVEKPFRIISLNPRGNKNTFVAIEHQDTVYPWIDREYVQDFPKTSFGNPFDLFPPTGATFVLGADFVKVSWFRSPDTNVKAYAVDLYDDTETLIKGETTVDDFIIFKGLSSGTYVVKIYAVSPLGISQPSEVGFSIVALVSRLPYLNDNYNSMSFTPNDYRIIPYITAVHFYYSPTDYGASPNTSLAVNGGVGSSVIINDPIAEVTYNVWYGSGIAPWYKAKVKLDTSVSIRYYIRYPDGQIIKNGEGTLTVESRQVSSAGDVLTTNGIDPQLYANGLPLGNTGTYDSITIDGEILITLQDNGVVLDAVTLADILDGTAGVQGYFEAPSNGLSWVKDTVLDQWSPVALTTVLTARFYSAGLEIASRSIIFTLDGDTGLIIGSLQSSTGEPTTHSFTGSLTSAITLTVVHTESGATVSESVTALSGGAAAPEKFSWTVYSDSQTTGSIFLTKGDRKYTGVAHNQLMEEADLTDSPENRALYTWYLSIDVIDFGDATILTGTLDAAYINVGSVFATDVTATGSISHINGSNKAVLGGNALISASDSTGLVFEIGAGGTGFFNGAIVNAGSLPAGALSGAAIDEIRDLIGVAAPSSGGSVSVDYTVTGSSLTVNTPVFTHGTAIPEVTFYGYKSIIVDDFGTPIADSISIQIQRVVAGVATTIYGPTQHFADEDPIGGKDLTRFTWAKTIIVNDTAIAVGSGTSVSYRVLITGVDPLLRPTGTFGATEDAVGGASEGGTDALTLNGKTNDESAVANTIVERTALGDVNAVAFSSTLATDNSTIVHIMTKNGTDNYLRPTAVATFRTNFLDFYYANKVSGSTQVFAGIVQAPNITATSDINVKSNLVEIPDALKKAAFIGGYTFDRSDLGGMRDGGVIAQLVQMVYPDGVIDHDGLLAVRTPATIGLLFQAFTETLKRLEACEAELRGLK